MEDKRFPEPVEALLVILGTFLFTIGIAGIPILWSVLSGSSLEALTRWVLVLGPIPYLIFPIIYIKIRKYHAGAIFRFRAVPVEVLFMSMLLGLALSVVGDELDRLIQIVLPMPQSLIEQLQFMRAETYSDWVVLLLGVVLLTAFAEEISFRGFLQVSLERKGDPTRAVLLTSLTWTMIHMNPWWAIQIFLMGVVIGFLAWRTNSIIPVIIVHGMNNLLSLIFYNIGDQLNWYLIGDHVSVYILIPAAAVVVWSIRQLTAWYRPVS
jgi:membrane protease YdiL (CAAX protease family)